jgi:hypothetical protein
LGRIALPLVKHDDPASPKFYLINALLTASEYISAFRKNDVQIRFAETSLMSLLSDTCTYHGQKHGMEKPEAFYCLQRNA